MKNSSSLIDAKPGIRYKVVRIRGGFGIKHRLRNLGLRRGKIIKKISSQPMKGPVLIEVDSSQVAIGYGMAKKIAVTEFE